MPGYAWVTPLAAAIMTVAVATLVARQGPRSELTAVFVFLSTVIVFWNLHFFFLYSVREYELAHALTRVTRSVIPFLPPAMLHLALAIRGAASPGWRALLACDYALAALLGVLSYLGLLVADIRLAPWGWVSVNTDLYVAFVLSVIVNFTAAVIVLLHRYSVATDATSRARIQFWLAGGLVAVPLTFTNLLQPYGLPIYPLGSLGSALWAGLVGYAIVRHRLMDIDVVVTRGVAYTAVGLVLVLPAFGITLWLQQVTFGTVDRDFSFTILLLLVAMGALFPTLRSRAETKLEHALFPAKHEGRKVLLSFSRTMVRILDTDRLLRDLAAALVDSLRADRVAIALASSDGRLLTVRHAVGTPPADEHLPAADPFVAALRRRGHASLREELAEAAPPADRARVRDLCARNGWHAVVPLEGGGSLAGFVALGAKRSHDPYFAGELQLLDSLGAQASIVLENARLYEEVRRSQEIIRRSDRLSALGTLAAGIAHEIRNPLVSIQTFFQLAPERLHDEEFLNRFLDVTAGEVRRITTLISELLNFARAHTPSTGPVDLNEVAGRVVSLLAPEARKHRVTLEAVADPEVPPVRADVDQVKQVLINLLLNAIQATPPGGRVTVLCRPARHEGRPYGQVEVRDTGSGIPPDVLESIFNPFFTTKDRGTGLGLTIAHQIVSEHGGFLTVESTEGVGTRFYVHLPLAGEEAASASAHAAVAAGAV